MNSMEAMEASMSRESATCPFCAESIKGAAILCKHCGSNLGHSVHQHGGASALSTNNALAQSRTREVYNKENGTGLGAMIWGIVGIFFPVLIFPSVIALVAGLVANRKVAKGSADNKGQALAAITLGAAGCLLAAFSYVFAISMLASS